MVVAWARTVVDAGLLGASSLVALSLTLVAALGGCAAHADHGAEQTTTTTTVDPTLAETPAHDAIVCTTFVSHGIMEHLAEVTLPAGTIALGPAVDADIVADATSIGIQGDHVLTCANTVVRIGLRDGKVEQTDVACDAVTADASAVWVASAGRLARYVDFAAVKAHAPRASVAIDEHRANRFAPAPDGTLLGAAFQLDKLLHLSPSTGAATSAITLKGYSGITLGLSDAGGDRVVVAPWYLDGGLFVFDVKTGALQQALPRPSTGEFFHGLSCRAATM